jgi:hypothetical protein
MPPMLIMRSGVPIVIPADYATAPEHRSLVARLQRARSYLDVVALLDAHPDSFLAADVLTGATWAQKFLNSTARLYVTDPKLARRGVRALMCVLNGTKPRTGRHRAAQPTPNAQAEAAYARWQLVVEEGWPDRAALLALVDHHRVLSRPHRRALRTLVGRDGLRKRDLILALTSWETGMPMRRLRMAPVAELVYA